MPEAIIVGGGIGGLCAALCLLEKGWQVSVLEQAPALTEVGAGLQISPNGMKVLKALNLDTLVCAAGFEPEGTELRIGQTGNVIFEVPMKNSALRRWGAPYIQIHRADLLQILIDAVEAVSPAIIRTNIRVEGYQIEDNKVQIRTDRNEPEMADLLIGADGIHSAIREAMLGSDRPRFTGNVAWRTVVPTERLGKNLPPPTGCAWVGPGRHSVTYPLRQGKLINWIGVVERDSWTEEGWTIPGSRTEALAEFADFHPVIHEIINQADTHFRWALHDRAPLEKWCDGPVALLGDACHPMLPFLAQGAVMALEDAYVLAKRVSEAGQVSEGLKQYENDRLIRTAKVQAGARSNMGLFHKRTRISQIATYAPMKMVANLAPSFIHSRMDWLYGHDVTQ